MATYTLKSAAASVTVTGGPGTSVSANLFTATGQTVVKSIVCCFSRPASPDSQIKVQKSGGTPITYNFITNFTGGQEVITANGAWPNNYLVLETGDMLIMTCFRDFEDVTMIGHASYTVIS